MEGLEPTHLSISVSKTDTATYYVTSPFNGGLSRTRTYDLSVNSRLLLPTELLVHNGQEGRI